ncbi:hypothetical protein WMY93_032005 [Mugilogobius chulae]|uniref:Uncharacterized protein n=1 Tax=Mugilogobius chulae TaxID=88201 RepID=A0AAW0MDP7_9GOBI
MVLEELLLKKDEDVYRENLLLQKKLDEKLQKIQDLEAQLTNKCQIVRCLGRDLTLAEKAVRDQLIDNNNLEERLEQETTLRQNLEAELHKLKEESERKVELTETSLGNECLQKQLVIQQQKITELEELVSKKHTGDNILGDELEKEQDITQDLQLQLMIQDYQQALNVIEEQLFEMNNLKEELAHQTRLREDAEEIMRILHKNGPIEFELTGESRGNEAVEEQELPQTQTSKSWDGRIKFR